MGSCLASTSQQELSASNMSRQRANMVANTNQEMVTEDTHFFIESKLNEGYSYDDLCIRYSTTQITTVSTSEFVTPKSYRAYSFKSFPDQYYASINPKRQLSIDK